MFSKLINIVRRLIRNSDQTAQAITGTRADLGRIRADLGKHSAKSTKVSKSVINKIDESTRAINQIGEVVAILAERDLERSAVNSRLARLVEIQSRKLSQILTADQNTFRSSLADLKAEIEIPSMPEFSDLISDYIRSDASRIKTALASIRDKKGLDVLLFSKRPEYFCSDDLIESNNTCIKSVTLLSDEKELGSMNGVFDIAIVCTHVQMEHVAELIIRSHNISPIIVAWTWDNHHSEYRNIRFNPMSDIIIPAHDYCGDMMRTPHAALAASVPLCCSQWSREMTARMLEEAKSLPRSDSLYGGFVVWGSPRDGLLVNLREQIPDNAITLFDSSRRLGQRSYFALSPAERFSEWLSYKVSLAMPLTNDLSMRVFDALMAGQIPIVPEGCYDLDSVISPKVQRELPLLRFKDMSVESIKETWQKAVRLYDESGVDGAQRRHKFARDHHHISVRLSQLTDYIMRISRAGCPLSIKVDYNGMGLSVDRIPPRRTSRKPKINNRSSSEPTQAKAGSVAGEVSPVSAKTADSGQK